MQQDIIVLLKMGVSMGNGFIYEVEIRLFFNDEEEAMGLIPFLRESLNCRNKWETKLFCPELFEGGKLLRISKSVNKNQKIKLGYKNEDIGSFCNIRAELDEDITNGCQDSFIIKNILCIKTNTGDDAQKVLEENGYKKFIWFEGSSKKGRYQDYLLKLLRCGSFGYPLLLEIEKNAQSLENALENEKEIYQLIKNLGVMDRVVRKEPPTLVFERLNGQQVTQSQSTT